MSYQQAFQEGITFEAFLERVESNRELWHAISKRVHAPDGTAEALGTLPKPRRLLVLADDWCGDAVNIVPMVSAVADAGDRVELRIVGRETYPEIMDRHLTNGARSIPVVIALDEAGECLGWWGPRPAPLQTWFDREGRGMPSDARYKELRAWYARDRGLTIAREISDLLSTADGTPSPDSVQPCRDVRVA